MPPTDPEPRVDFWDTNKHAVTLEHETIEAAVDAWIDEALGNPTEVVVYGWRRAKVEEVDIQYTAEWALEEVLRRLDEEYDASDDGPQNTPDDQMREAAFTFVRAVVARYTPWHCEQVAEVTVDCRQRPYRVVRREGAK